MGEYCSWQERRQCGRAVVYERFRAAPAHRRGGHLANGNDDGCDKPGIRGSEEVSAIGNWGTDPLLFGLSLLVHHDLPNLVSLIGASAVAGV